MVEIVSAYIKLGNGSGRVSRREARDMEGPGQIEINLTRILDANFLLQIRLPKNRDVQQIAGANQQALDGCCGFVVCIDLRRFFTGKDRLTVRDTAQETHAQDDAPAMPAL